MHEEALSANKAIRKARGSCALESGLWQTTEPATTGLHRPIAMLGYISARGGRGEFHDCGRHTCCAPQLFNACSHVRRSGPGMKFSNPGFRNVMQR